VRSTKTDPVTVTVSSTAKLSGIIISISRCLSAHTLRITWSDCVVVWALHSLSLAGHSFDHKTTSCDLYFQKWSVNH